MKSDQSKTKSELIQELQLLRKDVGTQNSTENKLIENYLNQKTTSQGKLLEITRQLSGSLDPIQVLDQVAHQAHNLLDAYGCMFYKLDKDGKALTPLIVVEPGDREVILNTKLDIDSSLTGLAIKEKQSKIFNDARKHPNAHQIPGTPILKDEHLLISPFIVNSTVLGAMLLNRLGTIFTEDDLLLSETFASYAAIALKNANSYQDLLGEIAERKQAEETLRVSEEKHRNIINNSTNLFYSHTPEHELTYLSPQAEDILGYSPAEVMVKWTELASDNPINKAGFQITCKAIETGQAQPPYELELVHKTGNKIPVEVREAPVVVGGKTESIVGSLTDITERKQAEKAIMESEEKYHTLTENIQVGIYRNTIGPEGKFIEANSAALQMFGFDSREEMYNITISDLYQNPADRIAFNEKMLKDGRVTSEELSLKRKDGTAFVGSLTSVVVKDEHNEILYFDGVVEDITERKQAEEKLRRSETLLRTLVDNLPMAIYAKDTAGRKTLTNSVDARNLGVSTKEEAIGKTDFDFFPEEQAKKYYADDQQVIKTRKAVLNREEVLTLPDGTDIMLLTSKVPLFDSKNQITGLIGLGLDITERKQLEAQLRHSQKLESITRLTGGIAHDFNNILGAIFGSVDMILMNVPEDHPARRFANIILDKGQKAADLVKQMMAYSRQQQLNMKPLNINKTIEDLSMLLGSAVEERINLKLKLANDLSPINGDKTAIDQIVMNLCINATDAMKEGGKLTVRTENLENVDKYVNQLPNIELGEYVLLRITDTGHGIEPDNIEQIFEPFFTTKDVGEGTGLGLSMVFGLVKQLKGYISCKSKVGQGTTFEVFFPVVDKLQTTKKREHTNTQLYHGSGTIMVVEDEKDLIDILEVMLTELNYDIVTASNGVTALQLYRDAGKQIDLVISDIIMPVHSKNVNCTSKAPYRQLNV